MNFFHNEKTLDFIVKKYNNPTLEVNIKAFMKGYDIC